MVITGYPKFSHKLCKAIRQAKNVGSNRPLYNDTEKSEHFFKQKNIKIIKRAHAFKGYANSFNVETLKFF